MPRTARTDARYAIPKYYDSAGNELDKPDGEIVDWRDMRREIAHLREIIKRAAAADTIELAKSILEEA